MRHTSKLAILLVSLAICALLTAGDQSPQPQPSATHDAEAQSNVRIFVEAFVVRAKLPELYAMGVCPLSSGSNGISAKHVMECLKQGDAEIICGSKLALVPMGKGSVEQQQKQTTRKTTHVRVPTTSRRSSTSQDEGQRTQTSRTQRPRTPDTGNSQSSRPARTLPSRPPSRPPAVPTTPPARRTEANTTLTAKNFDALAATVGNDISVNFSYRMVSNDETQPGEDFVSSEQELSFKSVAVLKPGKPQIVGTTQQGHEAILLILTASVED